MCGIDEFVSNKLKENHLIKMTKALVHRGPDSEGVYLNKSKGIRFGHGRLSIIDLSNNTNQPTTSHCANI